MKNIPLFTGRAHVYGDHVDTDRIIPGKYTKTLDRTVLAAHVLEDLDPDFRSHLHPGDVLVAGRNFGCGSSREQAPLALKYAGVAAICAVSFARIFFRNAINIGLPVLEIGDHTIRTGNRISVNLGQGEAKDLVAGEVYHALPLPSVMLNILSAGGLAPYLKTFGSYQL